MLNFIGRVRNRNQILRKASDCVTLDGLKFFIGFQPAWYRLLAQNFHPLIKHSRSRLSYTSLSNKHGVLPALRTASCNAAPTQSYRVLDLKRCCAVALGMTHSTLSSLALLPVLYIYTKPGGSLFHRSRPVPLCRTTAHFNALRHAVTYSA